MKVDLTQSKATYDVFLQTTQYTYNQRGWLKTNSSSLFSMELKYNDGVAPRYNGNISQQVYTNGSANTFSYGYDKLNRLESSVAGGSLGETITYDVMGNIKTLARDGYGTNDYHINLYAGNQLKQISGFTNGTYTYNDNGNLQVDGPNGNTITYNYLNLPMQVSGSQNVSYLYDAEGRKLRKQSGSTGTTDYINGIHYKTGGSIDFVQTEEGIARNNAGVYSYEYNQTDHLGNVRLSFYKNPSTGLEVLQRDDYYAFGQRKPFGTTGPNKYLYNGKELQEELGTASIGQFDYGARFYDPVIGRWNVVDALAEQDNQIDKSPYVYVWNNPIKLIDPDGNCPDHPCDGSCGQSMTKELSFIGEGISKSIRELPQKLLSFTDFNDATVLATSLTRGSGAINIDGTHATTLDKVAAGIGAVIPAVSGSALKKGLSLIGDKVVGAYGALKGEVKDAHHIIQDAAVRELPGYNKMDAPSIHLEGPPTTPGTPHNLATVTQRERRALGDGGTYKSEMNIGYRALRAAGLSPENAKEAIKMSNHYFNSINVTPSTPTRFPYTRR